MKHVKALSALALAFVLVVSLSAAAKAQATLTLTGRLTNDRGEALPGQRLYLNGPSFAFAFTDANGGYAFSVSAGTYSLEIGNADYQSSSVHAPSWYDLRTSSFDILQNTTLNLHLPFKKLSVHVQDSQGTGIVNVVLGADGPGVSNLTLGSLPAGTLFATGSSGYSSNSGSVTNVNGDVNLWLVPTATDPTSCETPTCDYTLIAYPPSGSQFPATVLYNVALTQDSSATIILKPPVTLSGQITDNDGHVLPGLRVGLSGATGGGLTTDANGRYAMSIAAGDYQFGVDNFPNIIGPHTSSSYYLSSPSFAIPQDMTLNLALPFQQVNVHVVDANDQPIVGAVVATNANEPYSDPVTFGGVPFRGNSFYEYNPYSGGGVPTDANGNATLWLFPSSDPTYRGYTITAYPPAETGLGPMSLINVYFTGGTSITIRPVPPVTFSGRITDAEGNGLPGQSITLTSVITGANGTTDSSGHYSIPVSRGYYRVDISGGVPLGSALHAAQRYFLSTQYQYYPFLLTQTMTIDLKLPFRRVNVHAVDANDQPVAGATVGTYLRTAEPLTFGGVTLWGTSSYEDDPVTHEMLKTDVNGNATLWLLQAGEQTTAGYRIGANAPSETGLGYDEVYPVYVTGETNITLRFTGALPTKAPVISGITPTSIGATSPSFTLVVTGADLYKSSVVRWNGAGRSTTFVSSTQLTATIPSTDIAAPGTANITVWTPAPGGGESSPIAFTINPPLRIFIPWVAVPPTE